MYEEYKTIKINKGYNLTSTLLDCETNNDIFLLKISCGWGGTQIQFFFFANKPKPFM